MASIGIQKEIVNRILNHGVSAMDTTYDHHDYFGEKRAALQLWADKLEQIVRAS